jgi:hypothetical protein
VSWTQNKAIQLCVLLEQIAPKFGAHVALTGGNLYKTGVRKDVDVLFYRIRQCAQIDLDGLWAALADVGFEKQSGFGWCYKATYLGSKKVDCFFPEAPRDADGNEIEYGAASVENQAKDAAIIVPDEEIFF